MNEKEEEYAASYAGKKYKGKHGFDVPLHPVDAEGASGDTTINKLLKEKKGPKVLLISNIALSCGHTKKHMQEFKELKETHGQDLGMLLFPSNSFK